jgi:starch phosphorylase
MSDTQQRIAQVDAVKRAISDHVRFTLGRDTGYATWRDVYMGTAWTVRDRLTERTAATRIRHQMQDVKRVYVLSLEYLVGRTLRSALVSLGMEGATAEALEELGYSLEELESAEPDAALGSTGRGAVAASWLESVATLNLPAYGYGIRFEHGTFRQAIDDHGRQVEKPESWLRDDNPWEISRPDRMYAVRFYGRVQSRTDQGGRMHFQWVETSDVLACALDTPVAGYRNNEVSTLRLWAARATEDFDVESFIQGNFVRAVESRFMAETITRMLYPPDDTGAGRELRLKQHYFLVSASLQDILRRYLTERRTFGEFSAKVQVQLNDAHPALAVPELMRLLMDEYGLEWDDSFGLVRDTFSFTSQTAPPEAPLEWAEDLLGRVLPRHLEIIREIDRRLRELIRERFPGDAAREERMAIVSGGVVRMANLALVGSHATVGMSRAHGEVLKGDTFRDLAELWPERVTVVSGGVSQRRWLLKANTGLSELLSDVLGEAWHVDLHALAELEPYAEDAAFRERWRAVRGWNRKRLARLLMEEAGVRADPAALADVHLTPVLQSRRQLLNVLRLVDAYLELRDDGAADAVPRTVVFAGKAAPTDWTAKLVLLLLNTVAAAVNDDALASRRLRIAFVPDYRVSLAERLIPAGDLSEQLSSAGCEPWGTSGIKLALNGALTIGTPTGANLDIAARVGEENLFLFGLSADEVAARTGAGYLPREVYEQSPRLRRALDFLASGALTPEDPGLFRPLVQGLLHHDAFMVLADFDAYLEAQASVDQAFRNAERWTRASILTVARSGPFSSDRAVREYSERIWGIDLPPAAAADHDAWPGAPNVAARRDVGGLFHAPAPSPGAVSGDGEVPRRAPGQPVAGPPPRVFISYKWQGPEQNEWVKRLATDLRLRGIDALLDVWEVSYGESFTDYMTSRIAAADAVLFVMTTESVRAVEAPSGGGGAVKFEIQMATARRTAGDKFRLIGIYREGQGPPAHLRDHRYADFRDDNRYEACLNALVDDLLGRTEKPGVGLP